MSYTINELLTWNRSFGEHSFDILAGHEADEQTYQYLEATKSNLFEGIMELRPATTNADCDSYSNVYAIESWLSRFNYSYADKYYLSTSFRRDGSSRFKAENRWGNFWSVGANWRISKESFMKDLTWLNNLNIKASYGVQGNDDLDTYYAWQSFYSLAWPMDNKQGAKVSSLENPEVTWEKNANFNVGFDAKMLGGRLDVSFEWYNRKTTDMLLNYPMALSTGFNGFNANVGSMVNKGVEFTVGGILIDRKNFLWKANFMGSSIKNITLGYTLPSGIAKRIGASKVRAYASLDNYMMFSHLNGMDPQHNIAGTTEISYAPTKTAVLGINLNF